MRLWGRVWPRAGRHPHKIKEASTTRNGPVLRAQPPTTLDTFILPSGRAIDSVRGVQKRRNAKMQMADSRSIRAGPAVVAQSALIQWIGPPINCRLRDFPPQRYGVGWLVLREPAQNGKLGAQR